MQNEPLKIKKYANRRLYDTEESRYITLAELAGIVRGGRRVEVVDARSGDDLTRQVLVQVILDEQERLDMLPIDMLHHVIRLQGTMQAGTFSSLLGESVERFGQLGEAWSKQVDGTLGPAATAAAEGARAWMGAVEGLFGGWGSAGAGRTGSAGSGPKSSGSAATPPGAPTAAAGQRVEPEPVADAADGQPVEPEPVADAADAGGGKEDLAADVQMLKEKMNELLKALGNQG